MAEKDEGWSFTRIGLIATLVGIAAWVWQASFSTSPGIIYKPEGAYDFIIVGGGTAGSVLAARLSEVEHFRVLLVEAGGEEPWLSHIPLAAPLLQRSRFDWQYLTAPQKWSSEALNDKQSAWPRGRVLGGSGTINYNIHMFGSPQDFDTWESDFGAIGWGFSEMKKYANMAECWRLRPKLFKQQEQCSYVPAGQQHHHPPKNECNSSDAVSQSEHIRQRQDAVQCYDPPLRLTTSDSELTETFLAAGRELGLPVGNLNDDIDYGVMAAQTNVYRGSRWSSARGYLRPALGRPNLHVLINTQVTRVVWEGSRAVGVQYVQWDNPHLNGTVYARGEVILSSGAINTPAVLMHSGVGNQDVLARFNIPPISALPGVGANLQDHLNLPLYVDLKKPVSLNLNKLQTFTNLWDYFVNGKGELGRTAIEGVGTIPINKLIPEVGIILFNMGAVDKQLYSEISNMKMDYFDATFPHMDNRSSEGFIFLASCLHPKSQGQVRLVSSDPIHPPSIDPNYLDHPYDIHCMRDAFKFAMRLVRTKAFQKLGASLHLPRFDKCVLRGGMGRGEARPSSIVDDTRSLYNEYVSCLIRIAAITGYHAMGTARIGREDDPMAVVDPQLRVFGTSRLRVADASVMPTQISGTPNSAIIVLAEKAAHMIKEAWNDKEKLSKQRICSTSDTCEEEILARLSSAGFHFHSISMGSTITLFVLLMFTTFLL